MKYEAYSQVLKYLQEDNTQIPERLILMHEIIYRMGVIDTLLLYRKYIPDGKENMEHLYFHENLVISYMTILINERRITVLSDKSSRYRQDTAKKQLTEVVEWIREDVRKASASDYPGKMKNYINVFYVSWENTRECLIPITKYEEIAHGKQ